MLVTGSAMDSNWDLKSYHMVLDIWTNKSSGVNKTTVLLWKDLDLLRLLVFKPVL